MTILIAGGGPAGSHLAEILAENGIKVLLIESLSNPETRAFSSAALPIDTIYSKQIPVESISSYWNTWQIIGPNKRLYKWQASKNLGVVLDFANLRKLFWAKLKRLGVEVYLGWKVKNVKNTEEYAQVDIISKKGEKKEFIVNLVIDATGSKRSILGFETFEKDKLFTGSGLEWILQTDESFFSKWKSSLSFFLGSNWVKYGYGWIFPMSNNRLKVGICRLPPNETLNLSNIDSLRNLILQNGLDKFEVLDKHCGFISSTIKRSETHYKNRIVGVGDCISTANLLGGEGIRHALKSSEVLSVILLKILNKNSFNTINELSKLKDFRKTLNGYFGWRWKISNKIGTKVWNNLYQEKSDVRLQKLIEKLYSSSTPEDLNSLLFDYKFEKYALKLIPYLIGIK